MYTDILDAAVCGESRPLATQFIRQAERFDRGFFGGPVGFVSATVCEFLVAIRSVLCEPRTLHIYAGAGIYGCGCGSTSVCGLKLLAYEALSY